MRPGGASRLISRPASAPISMASARGPRALCSQRRLAVRMREQPAEADRVAGNIGMAADRRLAGAVEHREECALAGNRASRYRRDRCAPALRACARRPRAFRCRWRLAPTAGRNSSALMILVACCVSPSRFMPASARIVASTSPASSLRSRVSTLPRSGTTRRSPRARLAIACRRSEAVPSVAPCGSSASEPALRLMNTSRGSSRSRQAASINPGWQNGRHVLGRMHGEIDAADRAALPRSPW